jgi:hypothetical protein
MHHTRMPRTCRHRQMRRTSYNRRTQALPARTRPRALPPRRPVHDRLHHAAMAQRSTQTTSRRTQMPALRRTSHSRRPRTRHPPQPSSPRRSKSRRNNSPSVTLRTLPQPQDSNSRPETATSLTTEGGGEPPRPPHRLRPGSVVRIVYGFQVQPGHTKW